MLQASCLPTPDLGLRSFLLHRTKYNKPYCSGSSRFLQSGLQRKEGLSAPISTTAPFQNPLKIVKTEVLSEILKFLSVRMSGVRKSEDIV